jgi:hypothetical protein
VDEGRAVNETVRDEIIVDIKARLDAGAVSFSRADVIALMDAQQEAMRDAAASMSDVSRWAQNWRKADDEIDELKRQLQARALEAK